MTYDCEFTSTNVVEYFIVSTDAYIISMVFSSILNLLTTVLRN
jgi:hypothetical protein